MTTILVTGGCGFIGSHFVRLLLQQTAWRVVNLDKLTYAGNRENLSGVEEGSRYRFVQGDIADRILVDTLLHEERPSAVVNFAAESHVDRSILDASPFLQTNLIGVQVLLEATRGSKLDRFLQISTDEAYGDADGKEPFHEASPLTPSSPYAASKAAADLLCLAYRRTFGLPILIARSSNNYGPYQFPEKFIPVLIRNGLRGEALPIYGDGLQRRDWLYVEDNCRALLKVLEKGRLGTIYNVGTGEERTNREMATALCRLLAEEASLDLSQLQGRMTFVSDRPGHDRRYAMRTERIREELAWTPQVPLEGGLRDTVRWYLGHQEWIERMTAGTYQTYYETVYNRAWGRAQ